MNQQQNLFSGIFLRDRGLDLTGLNNLPWLERIRDIATQISRRKGSVSADDLRAYAFENNDYPKHHNAWGAVFKGKGWLMVGRKKSTTISAHAREIKVWRWV